MLWCPFLCVALVVFLVFLQDFIAKCNFLKNKLKKGFTFIMLMESKFRNEKKTHQNDKYSSNKGLLKFDNKLCN
jgi:hypothetical protein